MGTALRAPSAPYYIITTDKQAFYRALNLALSRLY